MTRQLLYAHIDGTDVLEYNHDTTQLVASDGETGTAVLIGPVDLMDLGRELIKIGMQMTNKTEGAVHE